MDDQSATVDEARRNAQHEAIKGHIQRNVNADIQQRSEQATAGEAAQAEQVANTLRGKAIAEVAGKDREVSRSRGLARGAQIADYAFSLIYGLLAIRLVLSMIGARSSNGFVRLIGGVTSPLVALFRDIVPSPSIDGRYTLVLPIIVAMAFYALLHGAIRAGLRVMANRRTTI